MESYVIVGVIVLIVLASAAALYYAGTELYEWYIENFTTEPDPEHPEVEHKPKYDYYEWIDKYILSPGPAFRMWMEKLIADLIGELRGLFAMDEKPQKRYTYNGHDEDETSRLIKDVREALKEARKPIYHAGRLPKTGEKPGEKREMAMEFMYPEDDTWDASPRATRNRKDEWNTHYERTSPNTFKIRHNVRKLHKTRTIDMVGYKCTKCGGKFTPTIFDDKIQCGKCGRYAQRFKTSKIGSSRVPGPS